jgi:hypothetical protein
VHLDGPERGSTFTAGESAVGPGGHDLSNTDSNNNTYCITSVR